MAKKPLARNFVIAGSTSDKPAHDIRQQMDTAHNEKDFLRDLKKATKRVQRGRGSTKT
jgi:hypothetical protein